MTWFARCRLKKCQKKVDHHRVKPMRIFKTPPNFKPIHRIDGCCLAVSLAEKSHSPKMRASHRRRQIVCQFPVAAQCVGLSRTWHLRSKHRKPNIAWRPLEIAYTNSNTLIHSILIFLKQWTAIYCEIFLSSESLRTAESQIKDLRKNIKHVDCTSPGLLMHVSQFPHFQCLEGCSPLLPFLHP